MIHVMGDLETLATTPNALIMSIGAVKFDADKIIDRFHVGVELKDAQRYGLEIDADTVMWWMDPEREAARKALVEVGRVDLWSALDGFAMWVAQTPLDEQGDMWGNGATFDNVILKNAYTKVGLDYPFSYKQDACYRTMSRRLPELKVDRIGVHHSPVDDAETQAVHLQAICRQLGVEL